MGHVEWTIAGLLVDPGHLQGAEKQYHFGL